MTAQTVSALDDPLHRAGDAIEAAHEHIVATSLRESPGGQVGLELEFHLVDRADPMRRPTWAEVRTVADALPPLPAGSLVTLEPGGQIELSTPPGADAAAAVGALRADRAVLQEALAVAGYGAAPIGTDPARPVQRVNPAARYVAMEAHFTALGCARSGTAMMSATAALQVNLDAGPAAGWPRRIGLIRSLGPILVAVSACSPYLAGRSSGWRSMRQEVWHGIDHTRSDPVPGRDPTQAWARYALDAPVMLVRTGTAAVPVTQRVSFRAWLAGATAIDRPPTLADLEYHLTTLFPPIRPRGYVEIRCLDALPDRWWPAVAGLTATLVDDDVAADVAADLAAPVAEAWEAAARDGVGEPALRRAASGCLDIAARRCPPALKTDVESLAELVASGRSPGDELRARAAAAGPLSVLQEEADA